MSSGFVSRETHERVLEQVAELQAELDYWRGLLSPPTDETDIGQLLAAGLEHGAARILLMLRRIYPRRAGSGVIADCVGLAEGAVKVHVYRARIWAGRGVEIIDSRVGRLSNGYALTPAGVSAVDAALVLKPAPDPALERR